MMRKSIAQVMFGQDVVIKRDRGYISKELLAKCPTVKVVGRHGVSLDIIESKMLKS